MLDIFKEIIDKNFEIYSLFSIYDPLLKTCQFNDKKIITKIKKIADNIFHFDY